MKGVALSVMNVLCVLTGHAGGCRVFNSALGVHVLRWALELDS